MNVLKKYIFISLYCTQLISCDSNDFIQQSLEHAGNNREELEKVLHHYKDDKQKHEAAVFLISNIGGRYATVGERVDRLCHKSYLINMTGTSYRIKETKKITKKI